MGQGETRARGWVHEGDADAACRAPGQGGDREVSKDRLRIRRHAGSMSARSARTK
ncbi:hypothetical protein B0H17DRAFT_1070529 [Mycena rosella]|uniref:Uncharacterized protein n=1 Tax=Mycena rosella TaxID=1033263 RepID=A0AAD7DB68_MYCRO|nr:hypothetical protein B0H17DRAFT_1070529 [Mycena rosella]